MEEKAADAAIQCTTPETKKLVESMRYSLLAGGKRVRSSAGAAGSSSAPTARHGSPRAKNARRALPR